MIIEQRLADTNGEGGPSSEDKPKVIAWVLANFQQKGNGDLVRRREVDPGQSPGGRTWLSLIKGRRGLLTRLVS